MLGYVISAVAGAGAILLIWGAGEKEKALDAIFRATALVFVVGVVSLVGFGVQSFFDSTERQARLSKELQEAGAGAAGYSDQTAACEAEKVAKGMSEPEAVVACAK